MRGGQLTDIVDRAETALLATPIYQRGGLLTRAITLDTAIGNQHDVRREAGSTMLITVPRAVAHRADGPGAYMEESERQR